MMLQLRLCELAMPSSMLSWLVYLLYRLEYLQSSHLELYARLKQTTLLDKCRSKICSVKMCKGMNLICGSSREITLHDGLYYKDDALGIPVVPDLKSFILRELRDANHAGHVGYHRI